MTTAIQEAKKALRPFRDMPEHVMAIKAIGGVARRGGDVQGAISRAVATLSGLREEQGYDVKHGARIVKEKRVA
ncbi:hypothetical protein [Streptomyces smyrnaeus]|uniref:hypothetical protein n=1 Tax=Streptomyces smyrnaeus TaxID=1387713 RepID=UPI003685D2BE